MAKTPVVKSHTMKPKPPKYGPAFKIPRSLLWLGCALLFGSALIAALSRVDLKSRRFSSSSSSAGKTAAKKPIPAWKVVEIEGRGKGLVAVIDIQPGDRIMIDHPLVKLPPGSDRTIVAQDLLARINLLPEEDKAEYFTLSSNPSKLPQDPGARVTEEMMALNIFESNAVRSGNESALYKNACRINHSCLPNAMYSYRADINALVVQAVQFIASGEEILTPYFDAILHTREERQDYMQEAYHFHCDCAACSLEAEAREASDQRRARISDLKDVIEGWYQEKVEPEETLAAIEEAVDLYEKEGYGVSLGSWYVYGIAISAAHQDPESVKKWALKAAARYAIEAGKDSPDLRSIKIISANPKVAQAWGTRDERVF